MSIVKGKPAVAAGYYTDRDTIRRIQSSYSDYEDLFSGPSSKERLAECGFTLGLVSPGSGKPYVRMNTDEKGTLYSITRHHAHLYNVMSADADGAMLRIAVVSGEALVNNVPYAEQVWLDPGKKLDDLLEAIEEAELEDSDA